MVSNTHDYILFALSIIFALVYPFVMFTLKPKLQVKSVKYVKHPNQSYHLQISIVNNGWFNAINLQVEACILTGNYTYHLDVDRKEFVILPGLRSKSDRERIFKVYDLAISAKKYHDGDLEKLIFDVSKEDNSIIRIRVHATHGLTGFGRAFEKMFSCNEIK